MARWLLYKDGCHVLLENKTEAGTFYLPDRGVDYNTNTTQGEYIPEHVHHNFMFNDVYEKELKAAGKLPAQKGQFLPKGTFNRESEY